jgi:hypothetical protein
VIAQVAPLLDLLPGEETAVDVVWREAPPDDRVVRISGWNTGNAMSVDVTSGRVAATQLRTEANGGCVRLPYLVALLDAHGNAVPVPVEKRGDTADGTLVLSGETAGFHARAVLAPPSGPAGLRDTALTVTRTGEVPVIAGLRVEVHLGTTDDPAWLVPGLFYGREPGARLRPGLPPLPGRCPRPRRHGQPNLGLSSRPLRHPRRLRSRHPGRSRAGDRRAQ